MFGFVEGLYPFAVGRCGSGLDWFAIFCLPGVQSSSVVLALDLLKNFGGKRHS